MVEDVCSHPIALQIEFWPSDCVKSLLNKVGMNSNCWIERWMESGPSDHAQKFYSKSEMTSAIKLGDGSNFNRPIMLRFFLFN